MYRTAYVHISAQRMRANKTFVKAACANHKASATVETNFIYVWNVCL